MKIFDILAGRTKPAQPSLDALFRLPGANVTMQAQFGYQLGKSGGVCLQPAAGGRFNETFQDALKLVTGNGEVFKTFDDKFGFKWVVVNDDDPEGLITKLHMVNATLNENGWGPQLLCSVVKFEPQENSTNESLGVKKVYIVYLFKKSTFYPFAPIPGTEQRNSECELQIKTYLEEDLPIEKDLSAWFALWDLDI
jgi:hypothetical protein